jgi:membrane protein implicated in regulation of membrane protease activity
MEWPSDILAGIFLVCFFVGLLFTVISFFMDLGHDVAGLDVSHGDGVEHSGHAPLSGHGGAADQAGDGTTAKTPGQAGPSPVNLSTIMAFVTWFGGVGFILRSYLGAALLVALLAAIVAGLIGGMAVFIFLSRVLFANQRVLNQRDYELPGTLARVSSPIRAGGTGEIIYTKDGTRQVAGARGVGDAAIERGADVVIMRYERGMAYVQPWDELMRSDEPAEAPPPSPPPR